MTTCFGRRVRGEDLADDEPVAEHTDRGQVLLDGRGRAGVGPDVGGDVERRDGAQAEASRLAPRQKLPHRPPIRPASTISAGRATSAPLPVTTAVSAAAGRHQRLGQFRHLSPTADSPVDELLEPLVVVHERMGQRVQPPHGLLRSVEPHLDPVPRNRHPLGQARQLRVEGLDGKRHPDQLAPQRLASSAASQKFTDLHHRAPRRAESGKRRSDPSAAPDSSAGPGRAFPLSELALAPLSPLSSPFLVRQQRADLNS